jgi:ASC-1-like (ASCH) protein
MKYNMKLKEKYYNLILNNKKTVEIRLLDEKRKKIKMIL